MKNEIALQGVLLRFFRGLTPLLASLLVGLGIVKLSLLLLHIALDTSQWIIGISFALSTLIAMKTVTESFKQLATIDLQELLAGHIDVCKHHHSR